MLSYRCAVIQGVLSYRVCFHTECDLIQAVLSCSLCPHIECAVIQGVLSVLCSRVVGWNRVLNRTVTRNVLPAVFRSIYRQRMTSPLWSAQLDRLLPYIVHNVVSVTFDSRSINSFRHNGHYTWATSCSLLTQFTDEYRTVWGIKGDFVSKQH